jgi:predicted nucleic acid-binding protein
MNLVVADASPIHYLILVDAIDVLPKLFSRVVIPAHVINAELQSPKTPPLVRNWVAHIPPWVEIRNPVNPEPLHLHTGEEHAIALALELKAPVLLDEKEARQIAKNKGILVIGTVGIIERAADMNLLDIRKTLTELRRTNAHISDSIIDYAIRRHAQRTLRTKPP